MYRTDVTLKIEPLTRLEAFADDFESLFEKVVNGAVRKIEPDVLAALGETPGSVAYPIEWTSERQRRAFFATGGFGKGIPYRRTGRYAKGFKLRVIRTDNGVSIRTQNTVEYGKFVGGLLRPRGVSPQQRFHVNTGWEAVAPIAVYWQGRIAQQVEADLSPFLTVIP